MRILSHFLWITGLSITLAALLPGCRAVEGAGDVAVDTVSYVRGEYRAVVEEKIDDVYLASRKVLDDLEIVTVGSSKDGLTAELIGEGADNKKVVIHMERTGGRLVEIRIRVGLLGEKTMSKIIYEKMLGYLEG